MTHFLDYLADRVLLCDGAMGTQVQARNLDTERDFWGHENCTEILNESRPDLVREIHRLYLAAGCDALQTNSFGGSPITLGEFGIADKAFELNRRAAELAHEAIAEFAHDGRTRFVLGSLGPGTRLPSLGHIAYQEVEDALAIQSAGLLAGGIDALAIETCQDPLQIKAAVNGAKRACAEAGPMAKGHPDPRQRHGRDDRHVAGRRRYRRRRDRNQRPRCAGHRPQLRHRPARNGRARQMARRQLAGGDLGAAECRPAGADQRPHALPADPARAGAMARALRARGRGRHHRRLLRHRGGAYRRARPDAAADRAGPAAASAERRAISPGSPSVASLYGQVPLRQENAYLSIGERCNANGSRAFRRLQEAGDWDGCVEIGREQVKEGSHTLDVCTAFVGRDEIAEMSEVVSRMRGAINAPLVIDSTEYPVLEAALKLYGGKPIINSINFEDGEEAADKRLKLAKRFGAAVIALTIDEAGMAKECRRQAAHRRAAL